MIASSSQSASRNIEVVHRPSSASVSQPEEQLVTDFARNSTVLQDGYEAPFGFHLLEFADGGNTQIEVSVGDDAPEDLETYIGVHGMAGDVDAPYIHEILGPLIKDGCARGIVFNLRGCGDSTATSPSLHHGGSTSDLGAVITWVTMKWPKSKIYIIGTSLGGVIAAKTIGQWGDGCSVSANSTSFCLSSTPSAPPVPEHTAEIKAALAKSLRKIMSGRRIVPQTLTKFSKGFVAATAHYLSGDEFMAGTSTVNDLPNIRVPCLAVNCTDDPLMPGEHLPRSQAMESPFAVMAVPKKGGHLGRFTTKRWKKQHGNKRYHTALVEEWFKTNDDLKQLRPRPRILHAKQGFVYPEGHPQMAFRETTATYLKLKYTRPIYPKPRAA
ncbi:hypothetical protein FRC04_003904 [Tulasnella sp. 424]|nr:hypothetical protein FRC04_003904 [Tulasnella sp. 424]